MVIWVRRAWSRRHPGGAQDAAPAALKRDPADDARGDRIQLIARRGVGLGHAQPGQEKDGGHIRGKAAQDKDFDPVQLTLSAGGGAAWLQEARSLGWSAG